ncbi:MAG: immunoglobulin domain-containing protein, partial [Candidatus Didemnitutus sp.]|nr:immunoglobulin domain-containing protein [Candidatus Didemnitutus sp.]
MVARPGLSTRAFGRARNFIAAGLLRAVLLGVGLSASIAIAQAQAQDQGPVAVVTNISISSSFNNGIGQDATGITYWSDGYSLYRLRPTDSFPSTFLTIGGSGNNSVQRLGVTPAGLLIWTGNHTVHRTTSSGQSTLLAGVLGQSGYRDGPGAQALFNSPQGVAMDSSGTLYVADTNNHVIRKIAPDGTVSTLAGRAGFSGNADGVGDTARFMTPRSVAVDAAGHVFVAEGTSAIRRITPDGVVTTFAGSKSLSGLVDGPPGVARFNAQIQDIAFTPKGDLYVLENSSTRVLRRVSPDGTVTTVAGVAGATAELLDGVGSAARLSQPRWLAAGADGSLILADSFRLRRVLPEGLPYAPIINVQPQSATGALGRTVTLGVTAFGSPAPSYSWRKNGSLIAGTGGPTLTLTNLTNADAADYTVVVTNNLGSVTSTAATLTIVPAPTNDAFATRATLSGTPASAVTGFLGATRETGEPAHNGAGAGGSLWWSWTAPSTGFVSVDATSASVASIVKIYTGTAVDALTAVPAAPAYASTDTAARLTFAATAGMTYQIAVEPVGTVSGTARVSLGYTYLVSPVAGNSALWNGFGSTDGTGGDARFNGAHSIVRDSTGNFFISDSQNNTIRRMTPAGVVTTFAGTAGNYNYANGTGAAAAFRQPQGLAIDASNNLYVADSWNHSIRKITPAGVVSLLAGGGGESNSGFTNASGASARFNFPIGVAVDASGNVYVADYNNHVIRRVTAAGAVTTYAGSGTAGTVDGTGTAAQFNFPLSVALRGSTLYVTETGGNTTNLRAINLSNAAVTTIASSPQIPYGVRAVAVDATDHVYLTNGSFSPGFLRVSPQGAVAQILGGQVSSPNAYIDGDGLRSTFNTPFGATLDPAGNLWLTSYYTIRKAVPTSAALAPVLMSSPVDRTVEEGTRVALSAAVFGGPALSYQWAKNGTPITGATGAGLVFDPVALGDAGSYTVTITNASGSVVAAPAQLQVLPATTNDAFVAATVFTGTGASVSAFNPAATRETGEPVLHATATGGSLWWRWTAPHDGMIVADTAGSGIRTWLGVFTGSTVGALTSLGTTSTDQNDTPARLYLNVLAGTTYHFAVDGNAGAVGLLRLNVNYAYTVTDVAGLGNTAGSTDGTGSTARFSSPQALARDVAGNLYVADGNSRTIRKITPEGAVTTLAGAPVSNAYADGTGSAARFGYPSGITLDPAGNIYIADSGSQTIRKVTPEGVVTTLAGLGSTNGSTSGFADGTGDAARFSSPSQIAYGSDGALYVADNGNRVIRRVTLEGVVTTVAGAPGQGGYVDGPGAQARLSNNVNGLTAGADGAIYFSDTTNRTIRRLSVPGYVVSTVVGSPSSSNVRDGVGSNAQMGSPAGLSADAAGVLYVLDTTARVLRRISPDGHVVTLAGLNGNSGNTMGTGPEARFSNPVGIVAAPDGTVYIADSSAHLIRRAVPSYVPQAPVVTGVPTNQTVLAGSAVTFTVGYIGAPTPTFLWRRAGTLVATTTAATLVLPAVQAGDAGSYTVELVSGSNSVTTAAFILTVTPAAANNNFANRIALTGATVQTTGTNYLATSEPGEPLHFEGEANRSVWWSWTAPADGYYLVDTLGSSIVAMVAVYTGDTLANLVSRGSGLDRVTFAATAGTTYHIAVDGRAGATGLINLRIQAGYLATPWAATPGVAPQGVTQDTLGNAWFTATDHAIRRISPTGEVTVIAGAAGTSGSTDGVGAARFNSPHGITRAADGTLFVADSGNNVIRRIATDGTVTTIAGLAGSAGNTAGVGGAARFNSPRGLTLDATGENLYIADTFSRMIRKLELATATVTNFSGSGSNATSSSHDGGATFARYSSPTDIALAPDGNFYVTDTGMSAVRRVAPDGSVTTFAGVRFSTGFTDGPAGVARFQSLQNITVEPSGSLLVSDSHGVRRVTMTGEVITVLGVVSSSGEASGLGDQARFNTARGLSLVAGGGFLVDANNQRILRLNFGSTLLRPLISQNPASRSAFTGDAVTFSVTAFGVPTGLTYVWTRNNTPIPGANGQTLTLTNLATSASGEYRVTVSNTVGSAESAPATLTVTERPANDSFAAAAQLTGAEPFAVGTNAGATREPGEPLIAGQTGGASVWFRWTAPASGAVIADTAGSAFNTLVGIYTGTAFANLAPQASAVPVTVGSITRPTAAMFTAVEGTTYWIAVDSAYGETGDILLHLSFTYSFSTIAGSPGLAGEVNGVGSAARFRRLNASAPDGLGNIYIADLNNHAIRKVAADGTVTTLAGLPGVFTNAYTNATGTNARFNAPAGIAVGPDGQIYVADANNHAIRRITTAGVVTTFAGATTAISGTADGTGTGARFNQPVALTFDTVGNLFVAEYSNHAVRKITPGGVVTTVAGLKGTSGAVNANGTAARFNGPEGIAVDSAGNLYVADLNNHAIRRIAPNGDVTTVAGQLGGTGASDYVDGPVAIARFNGPNGVTALPDGSLLVADYWNNALRKITTSGYVLTLAGGNGAGHADGTGLGLKFNGPSQIAFDSTGRLYIADQGNHVLRRGIITSAPAAPDITQQPASIRIIAGSNVTLTSGAIGNPFPTYQWRRNGVPIEGATSATLTLTGAQPAVSGSYTFVATNTNGSATSEAAVVEILPLPANDGFNQRARLLGDNLSLKAYNFSATAQSGEPEHGGAPASKSVWFTWTAPASGDVFLDTIGSSFDTRLSIYEGATLATLQHLGSSVSESGKKFSKLRFTVAAGNTIHIAVDGVNGASGDFRLTLGYNFAFALYAGATNTPGNTNGNLSQARFNVPTAMTSDATGNLYVVDTENHVIRRITPAGVVSTFAGTAGSAGSTNGVGSAARFNRPFGITADKLGNLFVADTSNHTIRKIVVSSATVSTLAGTAGSTGTTDDTGAAARFNTPLGIAADASNNLYVTDYSNRTVRKVTQAGVVTTFAGTPATSGNLPRYFNTPWGVAVDAAGNVFVSDRADIRKIAPDGTASYFVGDQNGFDGYADGAGSAARFYTPTQLTIDPAGNLYVADQLNHVIRQVTPSGEVRTLGGHPGEPGHLNGTANDAFFAHPIGIHLDPGGFLYVGSSSMHIITIGLRQAGPRAPFISMQPADQAVTAGGSASFVVVAAGQPAPTYQWRKNNVNISGATSAVLTLNNLSSGDVANYDVVITNANGSVTSRAASLTLATAPANDAFGSVNLPNGTAAIATAFLTAATVESGEPAHAGKPAARSLWWNWTAPAGGTVVLHTLGSGVDTRLAVYTGAAVSSLALVVENDDAHADGTSRVQFTATAGVTYRIAVDVNGPAAGIVRLNLDYAPVIATLAGSAGSAGTTDGPAVNARFDGPFSLARDSQGNLYVADSLNHTIRRITPEGVVSTFAGSPGQAGSTDGTGSAARFNTPTSVAVDVLGRVVVADFGNHTIRRITPEGDVSTVAGSSGQTGSADGTGSAARFNGPLSVTTGPVVNGGGTIYVTDFNNHTVRRITTANVVTTLAGSAGQSGFADGTGSAARFNGPRGIAADASENLYLADFSNHTIRRITQAGEVTTYAGFPGSAGHTDAVGNSARFSSPAAVAVDSNGRLLVAELTNRIRLIDGSRIVSTIAGTSAAGSADGTGLTATFDGAIGIAVGPQGRFYVADYNSDTLRIATPSNLVVVPQTITFAPLPNRQF